MKKKNVDISIIIPYFRKKKYFHQSIKSVLNQTFKKYEIIIIYDDENKGDLKFIKKITKNCKLIKIIENNKNIGAGLSRNKGISISRGKYIAFLDADDYWKKEKLRYQINFMKKNNLNFSHTNYFLIDEKSKKYGCIKVKKELTYSDLMKSCDIGLSTVIINRTLLKGHNFPKLKTKEDYVLWLRLSRLNVKFCGLNKNLTYWRKLDDSLSNSLNQKLFDAFKVYFYYEKNNFIHSIFCVIRLSVYALLKKINSSLFTN